MSLVVVGSVAYDGVQTPYGRRERMLGGACTYVALAASYFTEVGVVGVVGEDFDPADRRFLEEHGVDLSGLEQAPGKTFYWSGVYSEDMNERVTLRTELNVFAAFRPQLPAHYRSRPYLFLGNIQPSLQREVQAQMHAPRLVGGDTMNYWIENQRDQLLATLAGWSVLLINDSEVRLLSGERNLRKAAEKIRALGPRILVIKRGEYGALLFTDDGPFLAPAYLLETVRDPTGAGDCFAGGFFGYLAEQGAEPDQTGIEARLLRRAVIYGSVMGSFCCEQFGVDRFRTLTRKEIDARFQEFKALTEF
ncbi:MAG: PfkB family carbohydrate kinase [Bryobacteraceae bacterium]